VPDRNSFADVQQRIHSIIVLLHENGYTGDSQSLAETIVANDTNRDNVIPEYSKALDDIYDLRVAAASEARIHQVHTDLAAFPKSRRDAAAASIARLCDATHQVNAPVTIEVESSQVGDDPRYEARVNIIALLLTRAGVDESETLDIAEAIVGGDLDEQVGHYLAASAEVAALRQILGEEADVIEGHLAFKSFPKSRRDIAEDQVRRMRAIAAGESIRHHYGYIHSRAVQHLLKDAGAPTGLTRGMWELNRAVA
jgi:hypothetical protein